MKQEDGGGTIVKIMEGHDHNKKVHNELTILGSCDRDTKYIISISMVIDDK